MITITDQFCGAGGSSIGAELAGGNLKLALNHWQLAIDTHQTNFPDADHDCCDVSAVNPRRYARTDVLLTSPECTHHSYARGRRGSGPNLFGDGDPAAERSRATMWDVPNFAEHHRYELIIVENVIEALRWEPFGAWLGAMHALGYEHRTVCFNSMFAWPTPQSRDRLYVVFWRKGAKVPDLDIGPVAWCSTCDETVESGQAWKNGRTAGRYGAQYVYRCRACNSVVQPVAYPAATAIDWNLPAERIGDRDKPLKPATIERIRRGLEKIGLQAMLAQTGGHTFERPGYARVWPVDDAGPTQTATACHALVVPTEGREGPQARGVDEPMRTQTARADSALVLANMAHNVPRSADEPAPCVTGGNRLAVVVPMRRNGAPTIADAEPAPTVCAGGNHHGLLTIKGRAGEARMQTLDEPVPTVVASGTNASHALVGLPRGVLVGNFNPGWARDVDQEPAGSITTKDHHGLLVPYRRHGSGSCTCAPAPTVTTVDPIGVVPVLDVHVEDCTFRMLQPHEIAAAMAFPADYVVLGNKRDRVRQYGNAVTPPVMRLLLERCLPALIGSAS